MEGDSECDLQTKLGVLKPPAHRIELSFKLHLFNPPWGSCLPFSCPAPLSCAVPGMFFSTSVILLLRTSPQLPAHLLQPALPCSPVLLFTYCSWKKSHLSYCISCYKYSISFTPLCSTVKQTEQIWHFQARRLWGGVETVVTSRVSPEGFCVSLVLSTQHPAPRR